MSNERLRGAILGAGLSLTDVAAHVEVDPKTVERWVSLGRVPHRTHRLKTAHLLKSDDVFLWPTTAGDPKTANASQAELVTLYPNRGAVPVETWTQLLSGARESIDLLAYAASFLHDGIPGFAETLVDKARQGVRVRLLFGDPEAPAVALRGEEEGIGDLLGARCRLSWGYLAPILRTPGLEARQHGTTLYNSIFRFDNTLLANAHTIGAPASHSPVLHLQRVPGGRLFTHYMSGFEYTWDRADSLDG